MYYLFYIHIPLKATTRYVESTGYYAF